MDRRPQRTWLAAVLVASTLALSGGTAVAAGPLTEKAVKKIAKSQVKKLAPRLSVAKAKNADALGGRPASAYLQKSGVRADGVAASSNIDITFDSPSAILSKTLNAPQDGYLFIVGTLSAYRDVGEGTISIVQYQLALDGTPLTTDGAYHGFWLSNDVPWQSGAISSVVPVAAGTHTISLLANDDGGGAQVRGRDLSILFTPTGSASVLPY
jgi:hypothetical protein